MKKVCFIIILLGLILINKTDAQIVTHSNGEIEIPNVNTAAGPLGGGSLLWFSSGSPNTAIQENWGLNLIGEPLRPVRVYNASLLVGYYQNGTNFGTNNLLVSGNVGIGTTSPKGNLHVMGTFITGANIDPGYYNTNYLANTGQMLIGWNRTGGSGETDFISNLGGGSLGGFAFYNHDNNNIEAQLMWIQGNGNVLIGKTTQLNNSYKLDVNGNVRSNSVVVNTTGADFVFEPTYTLPSLTDVKAYIEKYHHLPEIPSAKEMQTNGLNVGDNETKLLQKVEELTLYLIEKDKEIKEEKQTNAQTTELLKSQQAEIELLKQQMATLFKNNKN